MYHVIVYVNNLVMFEETLRMQLQEKLTTAVAKLLTWMEANILKVFKTDHECDAKRLVEFAKLLVMRVGEWSFMNGKKLKFLRRIDCKAWMGKIKYENECVVGMIYCMDSGLRRRMVEQIHIRKQLMATQELELLSIAPTNKTTCINNIVVFFLFVFCRYPERTCKLGSSVHWKILSILIVSKAEFTLCN